MFRIYATNECDLHKLISHYVSSLLDSATKYKPSFDSRTPLVNADDDREILPNHIIQGTCSRGGRSPVTVQSKIVPSPLFLTNMWYLLAPPKFLRILEEVKIKALFLTLTDRC